MNPLDSSELTKASERLLNDEIVAIPTETVYGLAASIESEKGLKKIFATKERPFFDPLIVHVATFRQAASVAKDWSPLTDFLTRTFWPGPLTVVVPKANSVNPLITSGLETVAVRMPSHPLALDLIRLVGSPLAAPSANKFGRTSPSCAAHVQAEFPGEDLLIIDGGECDIGVESTVVQVQDDRIEILRPGAITQEMIEGALRKWSKKVEVTRRSSAASPGHLKHHYMPKIPLVIVKQTPEQELDALTVKDLETRLRLKIRNPVELRLSEDPGVAARELYSEMRRLGESGADLIYFKDPGAQSGLWTAIWDRLEKAATLDLRS